MLLHFLCDTFQERELSANQRNVSFEKKPPSTWVKMGVGLCLKVIFLKLYYIIGIPIPEKWGDWQNGELCTYLRLSVFQWSEILNSRLTLGG